MLNKYRYFLATPLAVLASLMAPLTTELRAESPKSSPPESRSDGRGDFPADRPGAAGVKAAAIPITYHGGPILTGTTNVYYIFYGAFETAAISVLTNLALNIGGTPYYNINTTYTNGSGGRVANAVAFGGSTTDNYSLGKNLSDAQILQAVSNAISSGRLPKDANAVYFLLTSADVTATSGFCTQYCGWHDHATVGGVDIKYSFVGNSQRKCLRSCAAQTTSPNAMPGIDGMASVLAHELVEAVTDPDLNAWYDAQGYENADKCAWTFGTTSIAPNGSRYNMIIGGKYYLIQQNWVNAGAGYCALSY